ncbi:MAG: cytochrome C554 [Deltaproteobacteria bacterium]|nr:cytochrome C554 [Deltaproteobacteria bacterium]
MKGLRTIIWSGLVFLSLGLVSLAKTEILGDYVSYNACMECHPQVVDRWQATPHARAFETLKTQGDEKQKNPGCLKCHVVGFDKDGGFIDLDLTPELKGVQCESCHGPGRRHVETQDPVHIIGKPEEKSCRICHTEGQDKNFNFPKKSRLVHGNK